MLKEFDIHRFHLHIVSFTSDYTCKLCSVQTNSIRGGRNIIWTLYKTLWHIIIISIHISKICSHWILINVDILCIVLKVIISNLSFADRPISFRKPTWIGGLSSPPGLTFGCGISHCQCWNLLVAWKFSGYSFLKFHSRKLSVVHHECFCPDSIPILNLTHWRGLNGCYCALEVPKTNQLSFILILITYFIVWNKHSV